ncbi:hypothetical protein M409DRAFT_20607 [Zasmidium cellare ATCC 36951]|uniref:Uncharacterized protein n=1 Tax=Zasmidium cellare ATCC 36951 TaxID=1080233 RepID=A0A6A6CQ23_ZASCE|nr:uncharacterized protein M409DRAFT_20607 [Zasmidium cellare ATCC 36951]KAF2169387.1 hypothetical protein M409DRAFT_20607 [Zasmidium cellare ATCC 36951]
MTTASSSRSIPTPTSHTTGHNTLNQGIDIPAEVLSHAQEVESLPNISKLRSDQHIAQVDIPNLDGTTKRVILVVQQQKPATQSSGSHPGDASYYDDCVSDYSHEPQSHQSQASQTPQPSQSQRSRRTSADYGRMPEILAGNAARARRQVAQSIVSAPLGDNFVLMPSGVGHRVGEWFKVLQVYTVKATTKGKVIGAQAKAGLRQHSKTAGSVTARLISLGKDILTEFENSVAQTSSSASVQQSRGLEIIHMPTQNDINPEIKMWPVEHVLANDLRRRAAYGLPRFPPQQPISRKPAPLPQHGPLGEIALPDASSDRRKPSRHQTKWEEPFETTTPRECKSQATKATVNPAFDIQSQRGSLGAVTVASGVSQSTAKSPGSTTPAPFRWKV